MSSIGGKIVKNKDIRDYARIKDIRLWQIAEELGICDASFSRMLRKELDEVKKESIRSIIDKLAMQKEA